MKHFTCASNSPSSLCSFDGSHASRYCILHTYSLDRFRAPRMSKYVQRTTDVCNAWIGSEYQWSDGSFALQRLLPHVLSVPAVPCGVVWCGVRVGVPTWHVAVGACGEIPGAGGALWGWHASRHRVHHQQDGIHQGRVRVDEPGHITHTSVSLSHCY